jgi:hypothetical protein
MTQVNRPESICAPNIMMAYEKDANGARRIDVDVHVRRRRWNRPPDDADRGRRTHVTTYTLYLYWLVWYYVELYFLIFKLYYYFIFLVRWF